MEIPCPGCPVAIADIEGKIHSAQVESILRLNFSLSLNENDRLLMNDVQIYPINPVALTFTQLLTADQLVKSPAGTWEYAASPKLGWSLSISHPTSSSNNEQLDLVAIHIEILEVANNFVHGMPVVDLKLLETASGQLMIGNAEISPARSTASKPTDNGQECTTTICKWRAIVADKLSKLKGCAGKGRPGPHGKHGSGVRPHGRPRPHGGYRPHRHHRHGSIAKFLQSIVLHVFIPIMIGVVVGVTASLVGMVVGHFIVFIWRVVFRRGQRGQYRKVQQEETITEGDEETKSFLDNQAPPPTYEEAPAYEDTVTDKKTNEQGN